MQHTGVPAKDGFFRLENVKYALIAEKTQER